VHEDEIGHQARKDNADVGDVPEEVNVSEVLVEVGLALVV